nr:phosphonate metabolism protein/1,5-bisphosphokinase (PRPP-forming) PhnN [uncultured Shimia sp.]
MAAAVIGVVGPSGVGKDTVMQEMAARNPEVVLIRRVITRPSSAGGEAFDGVSEAEFRAMETAGHFVLCWQAHGLSYGIPRAQIEAIGSDGVALVNLSRAVLDTARARFEGFRVLSLVAPNDVLATRLGARGREDAADISARLERAGYTRPTGSDVIEISNDGDLNDTLGAIWAALYPESA